MEEWIWQVKLNVEGFLKAASFFYTMFEGLGTLSSIVFVHPILASISCAEWKKHLHSFEKQTKKKEVYKMMKIWMVRKLCHLPLILSKTELFWGANIILKKETAITKTPQVVLKLVGNCSWNILH